MAEYRRSLESSTHLDRFRAHHCGKPCGITPDPLDAPLDALANYPVDLSLKLTSYTAGVAGCCG